MNTLAVPTDRRKGWYLSLMAPNTKGPKFAWLDPSRLYYCVKDLLCPFQNEAIDLVAGIDAMGFILGKQLGLLAIRKAGHMCIQIQSQEYRDYSGLQVLIVDQWIETGGTMKAAIKLVERQGATIVGVDAVPIENSEGGKWIKEKYKLSLHPGGTTDSN
uniref:adenine phosphoribosyltransferase n=1 Tax=Oncorhynchus kisutch TaxID=8019 RepID=A0A8C7K1Q9_ONCKI